MVLNSFAPSGDWAKTGRADPPTVTYFRELIALWLSEAVITDPQQHADIVLATDEALANCADHAYRGSTPGTMTLTVSHDASLARVTVCVSDHGTWIDPQPHDPRSGRGRGISLMRALSDHCTIEGSPRGTTVCLHFERCPAVADRNRVSVDA
jgi:anti-sigma regulatory factor (Ser/Thr protein kinase)